MLNMKPILARQAQWQHDRAKLPWAVKIRMAEKVRQDVKSLKEGRERTR